MGAIFGALYGYERLTWTDSAKEKRFKDQVRKWVQRYSISTWYIWYSIENSGRMCSMDIVM